jgi:ArsR family transcriptional regulator, arsenate/arsenite/antimonite-responsive transcriptional repressor
MKKSLPVAACCVPGSSTLPKQDRDRLASQFKALGDPTRLAIVNCLASNGETCVCEFDVGLSQPTISHHLRVLREAGLVQAERRGTWVHYRLVPEAVESLAFALGAPRAPATAGSQSTGLVAAIASS